MFLRSFIESCYFQSKYSEIEIYLCIKCLFNIREHTNDFKKYEIKLFIKNGTYFKVTEMYDKTIRTTGAN